MSAEFEWNLIVLLRRQGKDCISMKWAIDLSDESRAPRWACHAAQFLWEPAALKVRQMIYINYLPALQWQYYYFVWETVVSMERWGLALQPTPNLTSAIRRASDLTWKSSTRFESWLQKLNGTCTFIKADFDMPWLVRWPWLFLIPTHKGQISAKCQKLETLWGPKYRGD